MRLKAAVARRRGDGQANATPNIRQYAGGNSYEVTELLAGDPADPLIVSTTPLRRVIKRGSQRVDGRFASRKMRGSIPFESLNEFAFLVSAELDPGVTQIYAQATQLNLTVDGKLRSYTPDFVVSYGDRVEVFEVKADEFSDDEETLALSASAARYLAGVNIDFHVALASVLEAKPVFEHAREVLRRLHHRVPMDTALAVSDHIQPESPLAIRQLIEVASRWGATLESCLALVARGALHLDYRLPIGKETLVWAPGAFPHSTRLLPLHNPQETAR